MTNRKTKKLLVLFISVLIIISALPLTVFADMGPKPSVNVTFENLGDEPCYATLLSERKSTGPASAWDGNEANAHHNQNENYGNYGLDYEIWKAFVEYEDTNGYYFLQQAWQIDESKEFTWGYYPPSSFKILLYFPNSKTFAVSSVYERYAFDSYYTVDMKGFDINDVDYDENKSNDEAIKEYKHDLNVRHAYDYLGEGLSLLVRIIITIAVELLIALLFCFRRKKEILFILYANLFTQIILNVLLNIINYNSGEFLFAINYVLLEFLVLGIETVIYAVFMRKKAEAPKKPWVYILYAFAANIASFLTGILLLNIMPFAF